MFRYMDDMFLEDLNENDQRVIREMNAISYMYISIAVGILIFFVNGTTLNFSGKMFNGFLIFFYTYLVTDKLWFSSFITFLMMIMLINLK